MASIGSADLLIVPKIQGGLANYINGELSKANVSSAGKAAGSSFMGGFTSGASIGIWSSVATKAIGAVTSSLDSAASRVDTLNNYPRIMESLGVNTDVANRSITTMSDALSNVPTRLEDMANTVQGIYAATMQYGTSLDTVTDAGLALNSMLLAGGQSAGVVTSAMEQFRQMAAKGKPDMQDWRSLMSAAPGQLDQLAKAMVGPTAGALDLYAALGGGKEGDYEGPAEWGSIGMGEFVERLAGMRGEFESAAEGAQGGIQTAFANMQNAVTKGVANVLDAFGQDRIAGAMNDVKAGINWVFGADDTKGLRSFATEVAPIVSNVWDDMVDGAARVADAVAPSMERVGDAIVTSLRDIEPAVGDTLSVVADIASDGTAIVATVAENVLPAISDAAAAMGPVLPYVLAAKVAFDGLGTVGGAVLGVTGAVKGLATGLGAVGQVLPMVASPGREATGAIREGGPT